MKLDRLFRTTAALTVVLLLASAVPATAARPYSQPLADKQAAAAAAQAQVNTLRDQAEAATERYDGARMRYNQVASQERAAQAEIARLTKRTKTLQSHLDTRVDVLYRQGPLGALSLLLSTDSIQQFVASYQALTEMSRRDSATIAQLKQTKAEKVVAHRKLAESAAEAAHQQKAMASAKAEVDAKLSAENHLLAGLNADVRDLLAKQKAAELAAARKRAAAARARLAAEARARAASGASHNHHTFTGGGNPPASGRGAKAVWWAMQALGSPYRWGAAGPSRFDCSGLVMWAYRHVGVSLPHHSGSQIGRGARVSRENLEPGDLVFFGSPIHHVGMYVGGGDFIEAPYTGANVRISSLSSRSDYAGACRP